MLGVAWIVACQALSLGAVEHDAAIRLIWAPLSHLGVPLCLIALQPSDRICTLVAASLLATASPRFTPFSSVSAIGPSKFRQSFHGGNGGSDGGSDGDGEEAIGVAATSAGRKKIGE